MTDATLTIVGPDVLELRPGEPMTIETNATTTNGREVKNASIRLDILASVKVEGLTITALVDGGAFPSDEYVLEATWLRSDGQRPRARKRVRVLSDGEEPEPEEPPVEEPPIEEPPVEEPPIEEPPIEEEPEVPPPPPPPPPPPSGNLPAMPVVRTLVLDRKHTDRRLNGWDDVDIVKGSAAQYVTDPLGERGTILRAPFTTSIAPGTSPIQKIQTLGALGLTEATFAIGLWVDDGFFGNWTGENKQNWFGINSEGNNVFLTLRGSGTVANFIPGIKIQGIVDPRRESSMNGFVRGGIVPRRKWVDIVIHARMNTYRTAHQQVAGFGWQGDKADGVLSLEVDGKLVDQLTDVNFTQASDLGITKLPKINAAMLHPTWGGGGSANPQLGHIHYDRLHICGR
jgi:hypothetical protein